jgi:hypothetical protein
MGDLSRGFHDFIRVHSLGTLGTEVEQNFLLITALYLLFLMFLSLLIIIIIYIGICICSYKHQCRISLRLIYIPVWSKNIGTLGTSGNYVEFMAKSVPNVKPPLGTLGTPLDAGH